ncbi:MAG TPA: cytochrome c oxidase assembly protein [Longimicrobiales bacterium]
MSLHLPAGLLLLHEGEFSWSAWEVHPSIWIGCTLFAAIYLAGIGPLRRRYGLADRVDPWRVVSFLSGVAILFLALTGPLHTLSDDYLFSAHMVQHMLLMLIMPPLLLVGTPAWLLRPLLRPRAMMRTARFLTHPAAAFLLYNIVFVGWHFPEMYNYALAHHGVHIVQHLMFMVVATIMWWPVTNPVPELTRLNSPLQLLYLFAFGIPMSVVSAFITLSDKVVYPWYAAAPRVFDITAIQDQRLGGLIMWVPGMLIYWAAVTIVFLRWSAREEKEEPHVQRLAAAAR